MTQKHSGLTRTYLPTFNLQEEIPKLGDIIEKTPIGTLFINHVALNHSGLNWKIFRHKLNPNNYESFIFAFLPRIQTLVIVEYGNSSQMLAN